jgi:hypothetical protein
MTSSSPRAIWGDDHAGHDMHDGMKHDMEHDMEHEGMSHGGG